jgi:hypothetical protein
VLNVSLFVLFSLNFNFAEYLLMLFFGYKDAFYTFQKKNSFKFFSLFFAKIVKIHHKRKQKPCSIKFPKNVHTLKPCSIKFPTKCSHSKTMFHQVPNKCSHSKTMFHQVPKKMNSQFTLRPNEHSSKCGPKMNFALFHSVSLSLSLLNG